MPTLSVVIATLNESRNIADCIRGAHFADEVVVLDSGSTDDTAALARAAGARVIETDWPGGGPQQNRAIDASTGEWIFHIDADERISPALAREIQAAIAGREFDVYDLPRRSLFLRRFLRHSGWWPDRIPRLHRRGSGRFNEHPAHPGFVATRPVGHLQEPLIHYSLRDLATVLEKVNRYSSGSARYLHSRGKRATLGGAIAHGLWAFLRTYFFRLGILDGAEGFMVSVTDAEGSYYKHLKLREIGLAGKPLIDEPKS